MPRESSPAPTRKVSFYLSPETIRQLGVVAIATDSDKSKVLEAILADAPAMKRWAISEEPGPGLARPETRARGNAGVRTPGKPK